MRTPNAMPRTSQLTDLVGVLAIVAGLILGLVPGIAPPGASANHGGWHNCSEPGALVKDKVVRLVYELEEVGGNRSLTLDTADGQLECHQKEAALRFVTDVDDSSPFDEFEGMHVWKLENQEGKTPSDAPDLHLSCSETYTGGQLSFAPENGGYDTNANQKGTPETAFDIANADWFIPGKGGKGDCKFPPITIKKVDAEGNGLAGAEFTLYKDGKVDKGVVQPKSGEPTFTCTTDANGDCTFGSLTGSKFALDETKIPAGYKKAPNLPVEIEPQKDGPNYTFTDPRISYAITVNPDGLNAVGNAHEFTVALTADGSPLGGATIDLAWSGVGSIVSPGSSCTTDSAGECKVVVNSDDPGSGTLTGTFQTPYQHTSGPAPGNSTTPGSSTGVTVPTCPDGQYAFAFRYQDGHTDSGCSSSNEPNRTSHPDLHVNTLHVSCSDDFSGGTAEKSDLDGHLVADYQIVKMKDGTVEKACPETPQPPDPDPFDSISDDATKGWVGYEVEISPDDTNLLGHEHPFTVTVFEIDGAGSPDRELAPGVDVVVSWSGTPAGSTLDTTTCTTDANGECVFTVDSDDNAGTGTLSVETITGTPTGTPEELTVDVGGVDADKTWREYRALIDDDSVNPTGTTHDFEVQVQYRETSSDSWTNAGADLTVDWTSSGVGFDDLGSSTCDDGTDADGRCTIVVFSDGDGSRTVTVESVSGASLPDGPQPFVFRDAAFASQPANADDTATKEWLGFGASITPTAHNKVGEPHTFTVDVFRFDGSGSPVGVPDGTIVDTELVWTPTDASNEVVENTCATTGTVNDQCTITVNTGVGGTVTATALGLQDYSFGGTTQDITFTTQPSASKTWYEYRAWVEPDAVNLVGDAHTFFVTAEQNSGSGWVPVPAGTVVGIADSGLDAIQSNSCATGTGDDPRTGANETNVCTVVVNSGTPGSIEVTVQTVSSDDAVDSPGPATVSQGDLEQGDSTSATKTWVEYFADIEPDEVALTGTSLTYYVTVTQDAGAGSEPVPAGTQVEVSDDNTDITPVEDTCATTGTGDDPRTSGTTETNVCTITVNSDVVDEVTARVDAVQALAVDPTGATQASYDNGDLSTAPGGSRTATKTWIDVAVDVDPDETNIAGEFHTFDVLIDVNTPSGVDTPDGTTAVVSSTGVGSVTGQTCDSPGTTGGACTVTVQSDVSGQRTVVVDAVSFTYAGQPFTVDFTDSSAAGEAASQDRDATKTWRAYRATIEPDGLDLVRNEQPSTVTIEQTDVANPTDADWGPVPAGTTATVDNSGGVGTIDPAAGTCETGGTDAAGECTAIANSTEAGTGTFEVTEIDLDHPATGSPTTVPAGTVLTSDSVDKTWIAFRSTITTDAVNITGDEHLFEVTTEYTDGGSAWAAVPDGTQVEVSAAGTGSVIDTGAFDTTCEAGVAGDGEGTTGGVCTVWVDSDTAGDLEVSVDGLTATITAAGLTETFDVAYGRDGSGDPNPGLLDGFDQTNRSGDGDDYASTKTWASYNLRLDPPEALNLLDGSVDDPEKNHEITAILTSDDPAGVAPVGNQTIDLAVDAGARITATEGGSITNGGRNATCVTASDGTCSIVITSDSPSRATVTGTYDAQVGASAPVTIPSDNDAVKTWTTFRVNVTPDQAINVVDSPHVFTVTVEQSSPAANCGSAWCPVQGSTPTIQVSGTGLAIDTSDCDAGTDAAGECDVVVTSSTVQAITLTATHTESYAAYDTEITGTASAAFSDDGDKDWIDYALTVDPPTDENLTGTDHVFTVTVTTTFPTASGPQTAPVVGGVPTISLSGLGAITDNGCDNGTDANGQCTVTITSSAAGDSTLTASYHGTAADDATGKTVSDSGDKLWVDYRLVINPPEATNAVGDPHTFTAMLSVDTGQGFGPAAGETLQFTLGGVGDVVGGDVDGALTCTTDADGQCDIIVNSDEGGSTDVGVSYGAVVGDTSATFADQGVKRWIDIDLVKTAVVGDGFGDGDLVADPETGLPTLFFTTSDQGPKTAVFEYVITNTGGNDLFDLTLVDDRLGGIDLATQSDCPDVLAVGESCTARESEQYTYQDAGALNNLITNVGVVTATGDDGSEVTATDDAVIQLIRQQSSILIDLVKDVVSGTGDVVDDEGNPTVTWSEEEFEAGESKTVRYRFTVTNVGTARIVDVELTDPMFGSQPIIAVADGVTLDPGESTVVEVDHQLTAAEAFPDGPTAGSVPNVATVSGANETRDQFDQDTDDAIVFVQVVFAEVELPATGLGNSGLLPLSLALVMFGTAILWMERRRRPGVR